MSAIPIELQVTTVESVCGETVFFIPFHISTDRFFYLMILTNR